MILLFDQNISFKISRKVQDIFPDAKHLSDLRMATASDIEIWEFAKNNNCCIVSCDYDFIDISNLKGFPPKIIWLRLGNTSTENLIEKIRQYHKIIFEFLDNDETAFLEIK